MSVCAGCIHMKRLKWIKTDEIWKCTHTQNIENKTGRYFWRDECQNKYKVTKMDWKNNERN
jgi:hypothetical protein